MPTPPIRRTVYYNPTVPNGQNGKRPGATDHGESKVDQERWLRPLEQVHGSGPHGWGIAAGLALAYTAGAQALVVQPGVALDAAGRHVVLAVNGKAEIGPAADNPSVAPQLVDVPATGVPYPTTGRTGAFYLTVTWRETLDADLWNSSNESIAELDHTPWLRLVPVGDITDATDTGDQVVLGRVQLAAGVVTALGHERRRSVQVPAERLVLRRAVSGAAGGGGRATSEPTGTISARPSGGIDVAVAQPGDEIDFHAATGGPVAKVSFAADRIVGRRADGRESVVLDPVLGNIRLGTQGVEGDVVVHDASGRRSIVLDGGDASVTVGAPGNEGDLRVLDAAGTVSTRVDGATGSTFLRRLGPATGNAVDVDAGFVRVHGIDLVLDGRSKGGQRALVDWVDKRLVVNFANDYSGGVDVTGLHLSDHVKTGYIEGFDVGKHPDRYERWTTLTEFGIGLPDRSWFCRSYCAVGMLDDGSVGNFWWGARDRSYVNEAGDIVVKWIVNYRDGGDDWRPWNWTVSWVAFRR